MKLFRSLLIALAVAGSLLPAHASQAAPPVGTLAYVRRGQEIRLVGADGQGDRLVWTHPNPEVAEAFGVTSLAWRPDGGALAFTSDHEQARSLYQSDLYTVGLDGTGLRRLTNAPAHAELARLPQGAVKVTVRRQLSLESGAILGPLVVYVVGADKPQTVTIGANDAQTLTFPRVAVLGDVAQPIVAIEGERRWMNPRVRVFAGRTIEAPARVFHGQQELNDAFKAGRLTGDFVAVVRFQGPRANGMPELHRLTTVLGILQDRGQRVALVTDGRMSGASGKVPAAIHVTPEALEDGPIGRIRDGDVIRLDAEAGTLEVLVPAAELARRPPAEADLSDNGFGMGRELFAGLRRMAGRADQGASVFG